MTTTDANGIVFLETTDNITPFQTLINTLQTGTSTAVEKAGRGPFYAADTTARSALYTAHGASSTSPLWVDMAGVLYRTVDGTNWSRVWPAPSAKLTMTGGQALTNSSITGVGWNGTPWNFGLTTGSSGITVPDAGYYLCTTTVSFAANGTGRRNVQLSVNGTAAGVRVQLGTVGSADSTDMSVSSLLQLTAGQTVSSLVLQTSGGTLNLLSAELSVAAQI